MLRNEIFIHQKFPNTKTPLSQEVFLIDPNVASGGWIGAAGQVPRHSLWRSEWL
jgi:hypothetical protein